MNTKEKLAALRQDVDALDKDLVALFEKRMAVSEKIGEVKAQGNMAILDVNREQQVLDAAMAQAEASNKLIVASFMRNLMALSKIRQREKSFGAPNLVFPDSEKCTKERPQVAFQGVRGAWGEVGAGRLFPNADISGVDYFDDVFESVKEGTYDFGVVPIENSQTGTIGETYDLLRRHGCFIVGQIWVPIAQCLLVKKGMKLMDVREVYSHPQGFGQCRRYLRNRNWELTACRNTAVAAQKVAERADNHGAAIGSREAATVYGLEVLATDIMDNAQNQTRFIAIAAKPQYDEKSTTVSVTFSTAHRAGALCAVLETFTLAGLNLSRIESRPVSVDKYRFFADIQANILAETTMASLQQAAAQCSYFEILGAY